MLRKLVQSVPFLALAAAVVMPGSAARAEDGMVVYNASCAVCHQAEGAGSPGQFPPLKDRVDKIAATPEGRSYLADVVLNGLHGPVKAAGEDYTGYMISMKSHSDEDLANVLTWLSSLGSSSPSPVIVPGEIAKERLTPKTNSDILAERNRLIAAHQLP